MLQAHQQIALALEALLLAGRGFGQRAGAQHLDRDVVAELEGVRDVDLGLRRAGDRLQEPVPLDHGKRRGLLIAPAAGLFVADVLHALPRGWTKPVQGRGAGRGSAAYCVTLLTS